MGILISKQALGVDCLVLQIASARDWTQQPDVHVMQAEEHSKAMLQPLNIAHRTLVVPPVQILISRQPQIPLCIPALSRIEAPVLRDQPGVPRITITQLSQHLGVKGRPLWSHQRNILCMPQLCNFFVCACRKARSLGD